MDSVSFKKGLEMANYIESKEDFDSLVIKSSKPVLVDFYADWCGPCQALSPKLEELKNQFSDQVSIVKVDVDKHQDLATNYGVRGIPAMYFFKDGEVKSQLVGNQPKDNIEGELKKLM